MNLTTIPDLKPVGGSLHPVGDESAFNGYPFVEITPALGREYRLVQFSEILGSDDNLRTWLS
jgi:hypothetical protein